MYPAAGSVLDLLRVHCWQRRKGFSASRQAIHRALGADDRGLRTLRLSRALFEHAGCRPSDCILSGQTGPKGQAWKLGPVGSVGKTSPEWKNHPHSGTRAERAAWNEVCEPQLRWPREARGFMQRVVARTDPQSTRSLPNHGDRSRITCLLARRSSAIRRARSPNVG